MGVNNILDSTRQYSIKECCIIHGATSWNVPKQTSYGLYSFDDGPELTYNQMQQVLRSGK